MHSYVKWRNKTQFINSQSEKQFDQLRNSKLFNILEYIISCWFFVVELGSFYAPLQFLHEPFLYSSQGGFLGPRAVKHIVGMGDKVYS